MDVMRKLMSHGGGRGGDSQAPPPDHSLGLMHLRKLFAELKQPVPGTTQTELENTLYNMLPLFCKVFGASPANDMMEKFPDILQFCSHVSRVMVTEIRRRASNISTDAASCAIVKFLEIESTEESSNGWMLLSTVNLLSMGATSLIDCMTVAAMPSTLVKCLYLFFDLPEVKDADCLEPGCEFTPRERRVLLQKIFVQVLVRLCSHASPAEELARKDDLTLLFSAITSWCPAHNVPWRKSAAEVLVTISRHGLTPNVVQYIHSKGCIAVCIDNMQRVHELSPIELVEMFVSVFCFLKDSSEVSQTLLDDFRACNGYLFLSEFLLKMEKNESEEAIQALRNLVLLVGSLCTCGFIELKPSTKTGTLFQMPGFTIPQPSSKGLSIRNLQAFQVLQTVFLKATSNQLCTTILDVFSSLYHQDGCNYFILDPQNTLSQFAEKIHLKHSDIQVKFFEIIEFIVFNLNFVPCKELISLSILIKTNSDLRCSILCMKTLQRILQHHTIYKDVFREVGLLEVMVTCLHRYAALLKEPTNGQVEESIPELEQTLGSLVMDAVSLLLNNNNNNANVFRESGGARCAHNMVPRAVCRAQALCIVQQLMLSTGGDDDMGTLLGLMHTTPPAAILLKQHILTSLLQVLKDSHRSRTVFRKVGGFVYVMSVLVSMEGALANPPKTPWDKVERRSIIDLVKLMFSAVTIAMRYEPANARVFSTEVRFTSLTEAVRLLGCFNNKISVEPACTGDLRPSEESPFHDLFKNITESTVVKDLPQTLVSAMLLLRYLYDMSLDNFDRISQASSAGNNSPSLKRITAAVDTSVVPASSPASTPSGLSSTTRRGSTGSLSLNLAPNAPEPLIVHSGAVVSLLHLVSAIYCDESSQLALDLQYEVCELIKSLVRTERNQQVMCDAGLPHELLTHATVTLSDEQHFLHSPLQYMFERLAAQSLAPKDLRDFLRLGSPLCCEYITVLESSVDPVIHDASSILPSIPIPSSTSAANNKCLGSTEHSSTGPGNSVKGCGSEAKMTADDPNSLAGQPVPLTRVKCLVSMTTPRDIRLHGASITPSFIEFDMSSEGFGCLYLPSIAPQSPAAPSVVSAGMIGGTDVGVVSGMGTGERIFPPNSGLTYSTWICVDKFCAPTVDAHPVRLLTVVRGLQGREESHICLSVFLSARDRSLYISSQELCLPSAGSDGDQDPVKNDNVVHFWCPELTQEGQWHHLTIVLHKAGILKNSSVSIYIDGAIVDTQKLHYISPYVNSGQASLASNSLISVFAYIGTPPAQRKTSQLLWRQGPCHLIEDAVTQSVVQFIYRLGPNYVGCFQAPSGDSTSETISSSVIGEERLMFGIHAHALSLMTIAKVRKVYNKLDARNIAKQLGMSAHENATPIRILHNSAGHLSGPARTFGAILMGYLGVRTFCPKPVARVVMNVGGTSALLGLVAMATDVEGLYAAVKALVCIVRSNGNAAREMDRTKGYQMLAMIFKKKRHLLNSHILHLTFSLVGTLDSGRESTTIPHRAAFESLLCDLEIWHAAPLDLQRSLYEHFFELLTESVEQKRNERLMHELGLVSRLLGVLSDSSVSRSTLYAVTSIIAVLLKSASHTPSLLKVGQFMASLVPSATVNERLFNDSPSPLLQGKHTPINGGDMFDMTGGDMFSVKLRNVFIEMFLKLCSSPASESNASISSHFSEELQRVLGFDWLLLFLQRHLHQSTVVLAASLLVRLLQSPQTLQRFREGGASAGGGWLSETEPILQNRVGVLLGFNVGSNNLKQPLRREINSDVCSLPGFISLQWLLSHHTRVPQLFFLLMAMLLGQPVKELPTNPQLDLDTVWLYVFGVAEGKATPLSKLTGKLDLCLEAAIVLLGMVRATLNMPVTDRAEDSWIKDYPITVMQFLLFLYHNQQDFVPLSMSGEFLAALASTVFPYRLPSETNSEVASPQDDFRPFPSADQMVLVEFNDKVSGSLSMHPAKRFVMDFLRRIVVDSLSLPQSNRTSPPVIDIVLEVSPEQSTRHERRLFQTEMLNIVMDQLLAADVLIGDQGALAVSTGSSYTQMANNVFYVAGRVVDKLWQGTYTRDPNEVFEFTSLLISQSKRKASGLSLDGIYKSLNRTILYLLSRPISSAVDQTNILNTLHKLITNRNLILGPGNYDQEFIGCLCYCLLQLTDSNPANISNPPNLRRTTWHVDTEPSSDSEAETPGGGLERFSSFGPSSAVSEEGLQLLVPAARRVWEELFVCKKPVIEDIFKVVLNSGTDLSRDKKHSTPDLLDIKGQIQDAAGRVWSTYYENECKGLYNQQDRIQSQLHTKLQKMGQGVMRFASRKVKKEAPVKVTYVSMQEWYNSTMMHASIVRDLVEVQSKQALQSQQHMTEYLMEDWIEIESELIRERGLWGPNVGSRLDKWMLDVTEGPYRMRKKLRRNPDFYLHYPYRPDLENSEQKYRTAQSHDSKKHYESHRTLTLLDTTDSSQLSEAAAATAAAAAAESQEASAQQKTIDEAMDEAFSGTKPTDMAEGTPTLLQHLPKQNPQALGNLDADDDVTDVEPAGVSTETDTESQVAVATPEQQPDNQTILKLLEEGETITHMFRCARIQGLDTVEGLLLFVKDHFYIVDGFTLLRTKEIADISCLPPHLHDPIIPRTTKGASHKRMCFKMAFDDVREVHKRRYLLQPIAVEIFSADGRNFLLAFPRKVRNKVYARFQSLAKELTDSAQESVSGQRQGAKVEQGTGIISSLIGEKSVTQRWERGEITNFEYLMCLNTLAGRSYNDLMQYPVFPWTVADYDSEELDLNDPATFRDLSAPMGAQTPDRLKQFKKRYQDWDDPMGETPPYHYGTHYSSAMIVASYLVRMEPFTQTFLKLQGGHFDLADRMFHSIKDAWTSASKHNMADVKELIPEFFYLPEFLNNTNKFDLGAKQSGVCLGDVVLPAWGKGEAREFIRAHREALECDYVSSRLHEWIDLIFGYKQQGSPAVEAVNVFHHLFYEGNVDIYAIDDPLKRTATIGFINNFGQIPKQLFKKQHPQKKLAIRSAPIVPMGSFVTSSTDRLLFYNLDNLRPSMQPIKELKNSVGQIIHNDRVMLAVEQNKTLIPPGYSKYLAWGFPDMSIRVGNYDSDKATSVFEQWAYGDVLCAVCPNDKTLVTAGTNTVVNVWRFGKGRGEKNRLILMRSLFGHTEAVTCLAASSSYNVIVSGSRDRTCIIWDLNELVFVRQLRGHPAPVAAIHINELTGDMATCAGTHLYLWTINGTEIASVNTATGRNQQILCVTMTQLKEWDINNVIITGNSDGVVRMWSLEYVEVPNESVATKSDQFRSLGPAEDPVISTSAISSALPIGQSESGVGLDSKTLLASRLEELSSKAGSSVESDGIGYAGFRAWLDEDRKSNPGAGDDLWDESEASPRRVKQEGNIFQMDTEDLNSSFDVGQGEDECQTDRFEVDRSSVSGQACSLTNDFCIITDAEVKEASGDGTVRAKVGQNPSGQETFAPVDSTADEASSGSATSPQPTSASAPVISPLSAGGGQAPRRGGLREGFHWQKQLVFRSKLTMHTAFERKDNKEPAAITALGIAKDHKTVYVGDGKGRVYSWSVVEHPGRSAADHWVKDDGGDSCVACSVRFSVYERRHHCRNCGQLFCSKCSSYETEIRRLRIIKPVRVCHGCYQTLNKTKDVKA